MQTELAGKVDELNSLRNLHAFGGSCHRRDGEAEPSTTDRYSRALGAWSAIASQAPEGPDRVVTLRGLPQPSPKHPPARCARDRIPPNFETRSQPIG